MRRSRVTFLAALAAAIVAVAALTIYLTVFKSGGCSTRLQSPNLYDTSGGVYMENVPLRTPYVYIVTPLCVKGGSARITSVEVNKPNGKIDVVDWAIQRAENKPAEPPTDGVPGRASGLQG
jgi:hypothetical protein